MASQAGDLAKVGNLQKLMMRVRSNTLVGVLAVGPPVSMNIHPQSREHEDAAPARDSRAGRSGVASLHGQRAGARVGGGRVGW